MSLINYIGSRGLVLIRVDAERKRKNAIAMKQVELKPDSISAEHQSSQGRRLSTLALPASYNSNPKAAKRPAARIPKL